MRNPSTPPPVLEVVEPLSIATAVKANANVPCVLPADDSAITALPAQNLDPPVPPPVEEPPSGPFLFAMEEWIINVDTHLPNLSEVRQTLFLRELAITWRFIYWTFVWLCGAFVLTIGLAVLAALPVAGFLSLGYMLEAGGRIARTGRIRDGFIGIWAAARVGSIVLGTWLMLLPLREISSLWVSAQIIEPDGPIARGWKIALTVLTILMGLHIIMACARGGKLRYFFWPFNFVWLLGRLWRGGFYGEARDACWDFAIGLRLPYYFWLGLRGFAGAFLLLLMPISLIAIGRFAPLLGFLGAFQLMFVLTYLPIMQMRFACENRFGAMFEWWAAREHFRRAPWAFAFSFLITLLFALPLYLLKIEAVPRELGWLPSLVFIVFIYPARLLTGWAYGRAQRRQTPRNWFFRWTGRLSMVPVTFFFVIIVYLTQFISWNGVWSLYEQHAFLLPVPFVGM